MTLALFWLIYWLTGWGFALLVWQTRHEMSLKTILFAGGTSMFIGPGVGIVWAVLIGDLARSERR